MSHDLDRGVRQLLTLPRARQRKALQTLLDQLGPAETSEEWNTAFGPTSLFDAWTRTTVARGVYAANAVALRLALDAAGPGWTAIEVGGGEGRLWRELLRANERGTLVVVDPVEEVHARVEAAIAGSQVGRYGGDVRLERIVAPVEALVERHGLPDADAAVVSLTLHHVAGSSAAQRAAAGLSGPGKREVLELLADRLRAKNGLLLLNEADVHCELDLEPGDPVLVDRLLDSYVRRCARSILDDLAGATAAGRQHEVDPTVHARWRAIVRRWCLDQVAMADVPVAERDVYELDVPRWLALLDDAGLRVERRGFTDDYGLFCQYQLRAR